MSEKNLQNRIRLALSKNGGSIVLRNNVGTFQTLDGRVVQAGLGKGTSDLIGLATRTVQPEDVGKPIGVFVALEVKTLGGRARPEQIAFIDRVRELGGIAGIVRSEKDAIDLISGSLRD